VAEQTGNVSKDTEKNPMEMLEIKNNTLTELRNMLNGFVS
jgi:hypothetical protein